MPAAPRKKLGFSDHQFRALAAWTKAQAAHDPDLGRTLRDMYKGGKNSEVTAMVLRAAVNPANTTVATWAAELIQTDTQPFLDRLMAEFDLSAAGRCGRALHVRQCRRAEDSGAGHHADAGRQLDRRKAAPSRSSGRRSPR